MYSAMSTSSTSIGWTTQIESESFQRVSERTQRRKLANVDRLVRSVGAVVTDQYEDVPSLSETRPCTERWLCRKCSNGPDTATPGSGNRTRSAIFRCQFPTNDSQVTMSSSPRDHDHDDAEPITDRVHDNSWSANLETPAHADDRELVVEQAVAAVDHTVPEITSTSSHTVTTDTRRRISTTRWPTRSTTNLTGSTSRSAAVADTSSASTLSNVYPHHG